MMFFSIVTGFTSLGLGFLLVLLQDWLGALYLDQFLAQNLVVLLVALLAINLTTMGLVLSQLRALIDSSDGQTLFAKTRQNMQHSVREQVFLISASLVALMFKESTRFESIAQFQLLLRSLVIACFVYAVWILYDTAKSVFVIIEFDVRNSSESD